MAEPTPNPTKTTEPTPPTPPTPPEPPAPNNGDNQKAIDDAVAAAKEKWEKELEQKLKDAENEGMRKAKLTNEQRKKEDDDKEREEFEKAKAEFEREKIVAYAETELAKVGLSAEIAKYIVAEDKDSTKAVIDKIKESYDKDVQAGVTERLKGKTPNLNGGSGGHNYSDRVWITDDEQDSLLSFLIEDTVNMIMAYCHIDTSKRHWTYYSGGRFYTTSGQAPQPFLVPALKNNISEIIAMFKEVYNS